MQPTSGPGPWVAALAAAVVCLLAPASARAQDSFEIQVYESDTAPPRGTGVEIHYNTFVVGHRQGEGGALPTHGVTHLTLEPHLGLTDWAEVGFYLQTAIRPDGLLDYAGLKLRFKARLPRRYAGFGFALNVEVSNIPTAYEVPWGSELRPILDVRAGRLYASLNPIVAIELSGDQAGRPQLEPCARVLFDVGAAIELGAEYYAALGPIDAPLAASQQVHRLFAVAEREWHAGGVRVGLHLGAGYGFAASERVLVKAIVGIDLDPPPDPRPAPPPDPPKDPPPAR